MQLACERFDLTEALREWMEPFREAAARGHVLLSLRREGASPEASASGADSLSAAASSGAGSSPEASSSGAGAASSATAPLWATADRGKLAIVVRNLLSNALKYTPPGGSVTVAVGEAQEADGAPGLRLAVADTGRGIAERDLPRLFDKFFQGQGAASGTGIGLFLVRVIARLHGGDVAVESRVGEGSTFTLTLPLCPPGVDAASVEGPVAPALGLTSLTEGRTASAGGQTASAEGAGASTEGQTSPAGGQAASPGGTAASGRAEGKTSRPVLLVVDDNDDVRAYVCLLLSARYEVIEASDGEQGLAAAEREVPDLVVADVMMPVMDGLELCRRLRRSTVTSHIPVVLLTACGEDAQRAEGYDMGADAYLSKPFSSEVLLSRVRNLLASRQALQSFYLSLAEASGRTTSGGISVDGGQGLPGMGQGPAGVGLSQAAVGHEEMAVVGQGQDAEGHALAAGDAAQAGEGAAQAVGPSDAGGAIAAQAAATPLRQRDRDFIERVQAYIDLHLGNADLSVEQMGADMALSRVQFYRKVKALTGTTPVDLLRRARLTRARRLLQETDKNVSEVAYEVGFTTPAYFTKCFRDEFGISPSDVRQG